MTRERVTGRPLLRRLARAAGAWTERWERGECYGFCARGSRRPSRTLIGLSHLTAVYPLGSHDSASSCYCCEMQAQQQCLTPTPFRTHASYSHAAQRGLSDYCVRYLFCRVVDAPEVLSGTDSAPLRPRAAALH